MREVVLKAVVPLDLLAVKEVQLQPGLAGFWRITRRER